ncbi:MAG: AMP-binding protein [Candidatus Aminicenantes bacterium]|nr:AMP-binding protein [Candidatus Aminicenantes bacterium]NIM83448.1 AMP-binding protein [Candidatus Aminicenantes bacterium]NIN22840.1 AMP-binding protein [Candidatus Aminicenantes bacterium]NIN46576.1 AMP-binding protein [Candidatus Aminicenantes bacterium]NIN89479.1 AMP-binding protein [Candidatus Aminicenantes bacterium]
MRNKTDMEELVIAAHQHIKEKNYWLSKLSGELVKSCFLSDFPKTGKNERRPEVVRFKFSPDICSRLMSLSSGSDHALNIVLMAGLISVLNKYTGSTDIIVGAPIYKQEIAREFVNTVLVLRNQFDENITFKELLLLVKQTVLEAADNYSYPIEILIEELKIPVSENADFPLFDIVVLLENIHDRNYIRHINTNMIFSFLRSDESIEGIVEFNSLLYRKITIEGISEHIKNLFQEVLFNVDMRVSEIDLLSEDEKQKLLYEFNDTKREYPAHKTIHELFAEQVEKTPGKTAVVFEGEELTYRDLNERANKLARILRKKGVKPGHIVPIIVEHSLEMIVGILSILKAGGTYLPIDEENPKNRVVSMLNDCQASILLTKSSILKNHSFTSLQGLQLTGVQPTRTAPRPQILDLDGLPMVDRSMIDFDRYSQYISVAPVKSSISIQGTRGCPYLCAYCHKIWPKRHVFRSAENIFAELEFYYKLGVKRFAMIDDIFNLDIENSSRFFKLIIDNGIEMQLFFPAGLRGDLLSENYIDLMIEAGTRGFPLALETGSPRLQKLIKKNLNLDKLHRNLEYICEKYPNVFLELQTMHGFPTETEEEAMMTLDFIKSLKWLHFPYVHILKIYPNTDMEKLAIENGVSAEAIRQSQELAWHELPETLPFDKSFTLQYQADFFNNYFLAKERLLHVLPYQMKIMTEDEVVQKYNSFLPVDIESFDDLSKFAGISKDELEGQKFLDEKSVTVTDFNRKIKKYYPTKESSADALRILLLDLSQFFSAESHILYDVVEQPLGLMYLATCLNQRFGNKVKIEIAKSRINFDNYEELKKLLEEFKPDIMGIRSLTFYKDFFHKTVEMIRQWTTDIPIIAGGPYATSLYSTVLQDRNIDLVVLGEGEMTTCEIVEKIIENGKRIPGEAVLNEIAGIAFVPNKSDSQEKFSRQIIILDELAEMTALEPGENPGHVNEPRDLAYVVYTSGSTGQSKGVMVEHKSLNNLCHWHNAYYSVTSADRAAKYAGFGFDASAWEIFPYLITGASLYIIDDKIKLDLIRLNDYFETNKITIAFLPTQIAEQFMKLDNQSLRALLTGGDKLKDYVKRDYCLVNNYGPTENTVVTTSFVVDEKYNNIPIGKPIYNNQVYILDKHLKLQPLGVPGELCISGASLARGYLRKETLTMEKFVANPFIEGGRLYRTGDLARWLHDGNIEFLGRIDSQTKIRGFRIELGEIENHLLSHDEIKEAVVIAGEGFETGAKDRYLCAYFVSNKELTGTDLREYLSRQLPGYMIPSYFVSLDRIPVTPNGKVDRKALPLPQLGGEDRVVVVPRNRLEEKLLEIWSEVLEVEKAKIGIDTNFFALGGHSLKATIMAAKVHKEFAAKIELAEMLEIPTIRGLAEYISRKDMEKYTPLEPVEKKEYYYLSSAQERLYFLQQVDVTSTAYNMPQVGILEGQVDKDKIEKTFGKLIQRHEMLRTSFEIIDEIPFQRIHDEVEFCLEYKDLVKEAGNREPTVREEKIIKGFIKPFDLGRTPLLRVGLFKTREAEYILIMDIHHIILDFSSYSILMDDFIALCEGKELPGLTLQYKDFCQWQNCRLQTEEMRRQEEYWLNEFKTEVPQLNLPTDYERPELKSIEGNHIRFEIGKEITQRLKSLALEEGVTLYMLLAALYNVLLWKLSGSGDILVGVVIAGRRPPGLQQVIGLFLNTLAHRSHPSGEKKFNDFLREVKEKMLEAFENQDYPFCELVKKVVSKRDPSRNTLLDIGLSLQDNIGVIENRALSQQTGFVLKPYDYENKIAKGDMIFNGVDTGDNLLITVEYSTKLFKEETIHSYIKYFKAIAFAVLETPGKKLEEIEVHSKEETEKIVSIIREKSKEVNVDFDI